MPSRITIAICTYNRAQILASVLLTDEIISQINKYDSISVLIVSNGSNELNNKTYEMQISKLTNGKFIKINEANLSNARNVAMSIISTKYIYFLDDDICINTKFISTISELSKKSDLIIFGGPVYPIVKDLPSWYRPEWNVRDYSNFNKRQIRFSGGNFGGITEIFKTFKFDTSLGMQRNKVKLGEERKFIEELLSSLNYNEDYKKVKYFKSLKVFEPIPDFKKTIKYRVKREFAISSNTSLENGSRSREIWRVFYKIGLYPFRKVFLLYNRYRKIYSSISHGSRQYRIIYTVLAFARLLGYIWKRIKRY